MNQSGRVHSIRLHVGDGQLRDVGQLVAVTGRGFEGDVKAGVEGRHVLMGDYSLLIASGMQPGDLQEQVTIELDGLQSLPPGTELTVGAARLVVTEACEPCKLFARRRGASDPRAFIRDMRDRRGVLAVVAAGGVIRAGDAVQVLGQAVEH